MFIARFVGRVNAGRAVACVCNVIRAASKDAMREHMEAGNYDGQLIHREKAIRKFQGD